MKKTKTKYQILRKKSEIESLVTNLLRSKEFCHDFETNSLKTHTGTFRVVGVAFAIVPEEIFYIPFNYPIEGISSLSELLDLLRVPIEDENIGKIGQNIKYEYRVWDACGIQLKNITLDTMIASYCLFGDKFSHSLDEMCLNHFGHIKIRTDDVIATQLEIPEEVQEETGKKKKKKKKVKKSELTMLGTPLEVVATYCCEDVEWTLRLANYFKYLFTLDYNQSSKRLYIEQENPLIEVLAKMECNGVYIDTKYLESLKDEFLKDISIIKTRLDEAAGFELSITKNEQLAEVIYDKLGLFAKNNIVPKKTKTGKRATNEKTLIKIANEPFIKDLAEIKKLNKLVTTYVKPLPAKISDRTNFLHCNFAQHITTTTRLASSDPNLQNIPKRTKEGQRIRGAFISRYPNGKIGSFDYSQQELRILAHLCKEPVLVETYRKNGDAHLAAASMVYKVPESEVTPTQRYLCKCVDKETLIRIISKDSNIERFIRIGELFSKDHKSDTFKSIKNKNIYSFSSDNKLIKISDIYKSKISKRMKIVTSGGTLVCSEQHKFKVNSGKLIEARSLSLGEELPLIENYLLKGSTQSLRFNPMTLEHGSIATINLNDDWGYFAGIFSGDGTCGSVTPSIVTGKTDLYIQWRKSLKDSLTRIGLEVREVEQNTCISYIFGSRRSNRLLKLLDLCEFSEKEDSFKKILRVPSWVINGLPSLRISYIAGLLDTDGSISKDGSTTIYTKDSVFASEIVTLIKSLGFSAYITITYNKLYKKNYYKVNLTRDIKKAVSSYLRCDYKRERLNSYLREHPKKFRKNITNKVLEISYLEEDILYDLTVESEDHLYVTNNLVTHNTIQYAILYGATIDRIAQEAKISFTEAEDLVARYMSRMTHVSGFIESTYEELYKYGYVETMFGSRRYLPKAYSLLKHNREAAKREAFNMKMQGAAAAQMKRAMIEICKFLEDYKTLIAIQVHDELVIDFHPDELDIAEDIKILMQDAVILDVPMLAEGKLESNWMLAH